MRIRQPQSSLISLLASGASPVYPCHVTPAQMRQHVTNRFAVSGAKGRVEIAAPNLEFSKWANACRCSSSRCFAGKAVVYLSKNRRPRLYSAYKCHYVYTLIVMSIFSAGDCLFKACLSLSTTL
jgi:hypothetical protein